MASTMDAMIAVGSFLLALGAIALVLIDGAGTTALLALVLGTGFLLLGIVSLEARRRRVATVAAVVLAVLGFLAAIPWMLDLPKVISPTEPRLLFHDEFDEPLDMTTPTRVGTWAPFDAAWYDLEHGYIDWAGMSWILNPNQELDGEKRSAYTVEDGVLRIEAFEIPDAWLPEIEASIQEMPHPVGHADMDFVHDQTDLEMVPWAGGLLATNREVFVMEYGYIEFRARVANPGRGMFPALWLLNADNHLGDRSKVGAEIDLFEVFGYETGYPFHATLHHKDDSWEGPQIPVYQIHEPTDEWRTYSLDWQPEYLRFYVDGELRAEHTGEDAEWFQGVRMAIRMNYAVNPRWMDESHHVDDTTPNPLYMEVDYVRVWEAMPDDPSVVTVSEPRDGVEVATLTGLLCLAFTAVGFRRLASR